MGAQVAISNRLVRTSIIEKLTSEQRVEEGERVSQSLLGGQVLQALDHQTTGPGPLRC